MADDWIENTTEQTWEERMYAQHVADMKAGEEWRSQVVAEHEEATKHDAGKPRMELLSSVALVEIAKVLTHGAVKYDCHNWRKGFKWSRVIGALLRHTFAWLGGEDKDPETGLSHLAHVGCCVMFLLEFEVKGLGEDDRYKAK